MEPSTSYQEEEEGLAVPLLQQHQDEEQQEIHSVGGETAATGDIEEGLHPGSDAGASHKTDEEVAAPFVLPGTSSVITYITELVRLLIFYAAVTTDALLLKELYSHQYWALAITATVFTGVPHLLMSVLLVVRQGWLQAASQACGFILTLNPFESLRPIPEGVLGLFVLAIGFVAYVLIAASGLIFVAYCVLCYLVTALMFSLLILDLAALVVTCAPKKSMFKYTDLVYTENFKFSRLVLQSWLQSLPQLGLMGWMALSNLAPEGPTYQVNNVIFMLALAAHLVNVWDKALLYSSAVRATGAGPWWHILFTLGLRGGFNCSRPVLEENLERVMRSGFIVHVSSYEDPDDVNSEQAASMVPEYLTPANGGLLAPGQLMAVTRAAFARFAGPGVWELVLEVSRDVRVGKVLTEACAAFPNLTTVRLVNARIAGADAHMLASALLSCRALRSLQVHNTHVDGQGAAALSALLQGTPTLQLLDLCKCRLRGTAATELSRGLRANRTLRTLSLAGTQLDKLAGADVAEALGCSKALENVNLAGCRLGAEAVASLAQALLHSPSLQTLAVSMPELGPKLGSKLVSAIHSSANPKQPLVIECHMALGSFAVTGLERVRFLCVADQDALLAESIAPGAAGAAGEDGAAAGAAAGAGTASGPGASGVNREAGSSAGVSSLAAGEAGGSAATAATHAGMGTSVSPPTVAAAGAAEEATTSGRQEPHGAALNSAVTGAVSLPQGSAADSISLVLPASPPSAAAPAASSTVASAATALPGPSLVFVMTQEEVMREAVRLPLYFEALDCVDLTGLGIGCTGATEAADVLRSNPHLRKLVLADNSIGQAGAAALGEALKSNTELQVLDLSGNEFDDDTVNALADALEGGCAALNELVLLGNKFPFALPTLRRLMEVERNNPQVRIVLVEDPLEALGRATADPWAHQAAVTFYAKQEAYREQRRHRQARKARQRQVLQQVLQEQQGQKGQQVQQEQQGQKEQQVQQEQQGQQGQQEESGGSEGVEAVTAGSGGGAELEGHDSSGSSGIVGVSGAAARTAAAEAGPSASTALPAVVASGHERVGMPAHSPAPSGASSCVDEDTCGICFDNDNHVAIKYCGHRLCVNCYRQVWEVSGSGASCPYCRAHLDGYIYLDWPLESE